MFLGVVRAFHEPRSKSAEVYSDKRCAVAILEENSYIAASSSGSSPAAVWAWTSTDLGPLLSGLTHQNFTE